MRFVFGEFELDGAVRELRRGGEMVRLAPRAFDLLELLLRERPRAVTVTRIRAALWPDAHVGATSLHVLVSHVRSALGDASKAPRWIRTVPRYGYAFHGPAFGGDAAAPPPAAGRGGCWLSTLGGDVRLPPGDNVLGREAGLAVRVDGPGVSRRHASIRVEGARATLTDLGSKNGTFVGERRLVGPVELHDGDEVRLGLRSTVVFRLCDSEETQTEVE
ncbi:MAG TPA: FHA domain-containing protein [Vicinamibacteria bacterium]